MAPQPEFPNAKLTLSYPLYACDFDPQDANKLVVGGGGGPGRSGVGNKITIINTASQSDLTPSGELDLSADEDSVSCLAVSYQKRGRSTLVFAGVNSSPADVKVGKNEHLRVFAAEATKSRAAVEASSGGAHVAEVSRTALFAATDPEEYQRVVRLAAPSASGAQVGVAASGLGKDFQVAVFETAGSAPAAPRARGRLELSRQADDVDVVQTGEEACQVVYCHEHELHVMDVGTGKGAAAEDGEPRLVFATPEDEGTGAPRPVFRAIRYLTPRFVLAIANLPKRKGVVLQAFRLDERPGEMARVAVSTRLPKKVAQATAFAVRNLGPATATAAPAAGRGGAVGRTQFVVAVAGHDSSVSLYTLEHKTVAGIDVLFDLLPLTTLRDVHPLQITGLAFSHFVPPPSPPRKNSMGAATGSGGVEPGQSAAAAARPQAVKLASVSMANTAVVHVVPLRKSVDRSVAQRKGGPPRPVRYVVAAESQRPSSRALVLALTFIVLLLAVAGQAVLEAMGTSPPVLGVTRFWNPYGTLRVPGDPFVDSVLGGNAGTGEGGGVASEGQEGEDWRERLSEGKDWGQEMGEGVVFEGAAEGEHESA